MKSRRKITSLDPEDAALIESDVAEIAASIPAHVWNGRSLPVPVEEIAREVYGLRVCHVSHDQMKEVVGDDSVEGTLSGLLLTGIGEIWVNQEEAAHPEWGTRRKRFTIGHELGHFVMHQVGRKPIFCRDAEVNNGSEPTPRTVPEVEANTFSAALLMPASMVRAELREDRTDRENLAVLMELFEASDKAMRRRVAALNAIA